MDRGRFAIIVCPRYAGPLVLAALLVVLLILATAGDAAAQEDDLFQVLGIRVDETDLTAAAARTKALQAGERRAWEIMVQRLVDPAQRAKIAALPQIGDAVKDFWVTDEKTSAVRYIATLNYNFRPDVVKRLLAGRSARFATTRSNPVLVLPVSISAGDSQTSTAGAWREAWRTAVRDRGLVPLRLAPADGGDAGAIASDPGLAADRGRLADLARRNGADDVLVTTATIATADAAGRHLKISSARYPASGSPQPLPDKTYPLGAPENDPAVFNEAAAAVIQDLQAAWRRSNAVSIKPVFRTVVWVPTLTLEDWVAMRRRLSELPQAERVQVLSVGREYATVAIAYPGGTDDLAAALTRYGLALRNDNGRWMIAEASTLPPQDDSAVPMTPDLVMPQQVPSR